MSLTLSLTVKNSFIAIALFSGLHGVWRYVAKAGNGTEQNYDVYKYLQLPVNSCLVNSYPQSILCVSHADHGSGWKYAIF